MNTKLITALIVAAIGTSAGTTLASQAECVLDGSLTLSGVERAQRPEKPQKKEKIGAVQGMQYLAREGAEGPRGADNERPGDRQHRGGKATEERAADLMAAEVERVQRPEKPQKKEKIGAVEGMQYLAREGAEGPRGADNERPGDRQGRGGRLHADTEGSLA